MTTLDKSGLLGIRVAGLSSPVATCTVPVTSPSPHRHTPPCTTIASWYSNFTHQDQVQVAKHFIFRLRGFWFEAQNTPRLLQDKEKIFITSAFNSPDKELSPVREQQSRALVSCALLTGRLLPTTPRGLVLQGRGQLLHEHTPPGLSQLTSTQNTEDLHPVVKAPMGPGERDLLESYLVSLA